MVLLQSFFLRFISFKYIPNARIDGTQIPIKIAEFASPLKNRYSEKMSERKAEINIIISVIENLLNIVLKDFSISKIILIIVKIVQSSVLYKILSEVWDSLMLPCQYEIKIFQLDSVEG